jgi:putative endonuclease
MERQRIGHAAEDTAVAFLRSRGLRILLRNFRLRLGEIDIVAIDGGTLAIIEVRTRSSERFGGAVASVDVRKQLKLKRTTQILLQRRKDLAALPARFDVIAVTRTGVEWIRHAFT